MYKLTNNYYSLGKENIIDIHGWIGLGIRNSILIEKGEGRDKQDRECRERPLE